MYSRSLSRRSTFTGWMSLLCFALLAGCAQLNTQPAANVDFSGDWVLVPELSKRVTPRVQRDRLLVQLTPALTATAMRIEQSLDSMGVNYVQGPYRDISWGKREKTGIDVAAGWEEDTLVVRSDYDRSVVEEIYSLDSANDRLILQLNLRGKLGKREFVHEFRRVR